MSAQVALYTAVQNACGKSFLSGAVQAAGGLSGGVLGSGSIRSIGDFSSTLTIILGVAAFGFAVVI